MVEHGTRVSLSQADIRRAYRKLAVQFHPDKYKVSRHSVVCECFEKKILFSVQGPDAQEKFLEISTAYDVSRPDISITLSPYCDCIPVCEFSARNDYVMLQYFKRSLFFGVLILYIAT